MNRNKTKDALQPWIETRKRGLLGKVLQEIFGANDEIYADLGKLGEQWQFKRRPVDSSKMLNWVIDKVNHISKVFAVWGGVAQ